MVNPQADAGRFLNLTFKTYRRQEESVLLCPTFGLSPAIHFTEFSLRDGAPGYRQLDCMDVVCGAGRPTDNKHPQDMIRFHPSKDRENNRGKDDECMIFRYSLRETH